MQCMLFYLASVIEHLTGLKIIPVMLNSLFTGADEVLINYFNN